MPPFLPCKHCAEEKWSWCHVQGCHLVAPSCSTSSKGFSLRQVPDSWALLSVAHQERLHRRPHRSYLCHWGLE